MGTQASKVHNDKNALAMKTANATLIAMLVNSSSSNPFAQADLYTFTLVGGGFLRLTNLDVDVLSGGNTYTANGPAIDTQTTKATGHWKVGLDVDTWVIELLPRPINVITGAAYPDTIGSQPMLAAIRAGALDGATLQVDRAYWPGGFPVPWKSPLVPGPAGYPTPTDYILSKIFVGRVSQVDCTRVSAIITVSSFLELLTTLMPRNLYQAGCAHQLFDPGCTLVAASFSRNGSISSVGSPANLLTSAVIAPAGSATYTLGRMVMTSGANNGFSRAVRTWNSGTGVFTLIAPFPFTVQVGDTFTAYAGCDKTQTTCNKFANIANFGGEAYIPVPETAL